MKVFANLSSGSSSALATPTTSFPLLLCGGATLLVDLKYGLVHKLGGAVRARGRLLVCDGTASRLRTYLDWLYETLCL